MADTPSAPPPDGRPDHGAAIAGPGDLPSPRPAPRRRRSLATRVAFAVVTLVAFVILCGLGTWQLQRLAWKEALIAAVAERPGAPAVAAPGPADWHPFDLDRWNYVHVALTGRYGPGEVHVWTVLGEPKGPLGGPGYFVMAPFTTTEGWHVLVNRGYVPERAEAVADRPGSAAPEGEVTVEGLVRRDDPPSWVTPDPDPARGRWFARDVASLGAHFGWPATETAPYTVDLLASETPPGGLPQAGETLMNFPNSHLQYALTWFGLAAALVGVVLVGLFRRRDPLPPPG